MKIANADKLKKHFENVVDVKLFTVPEICTIIDTFSSEVDENDIISRSILKEVTSKVVAEEIKEDEKVTYIINIKKKGNYTLYFIAAISLLLFINLIRYLIKVFYRNIKILSRNKSRYT